MDPDNFEKKAPRLAKIAFKIRHNVIYWNTKRDFPNSWGIFKAFLTENSAAVNHKSAENEKKSSKIRQSAEQTLLWNLKSSLKVNIFALILMVANKS